MRENLFPFPVHLLGLVCKNRVNFITHHKQKVTDAPLLFGISHYFPVLKQSTISTSEPEITNIGVCHLRLPRFSFLTLSLYFALGRTYHVVHLLRKEILSVGMSEQVISLGSVISNLMNEEDRCY
jgi:hypothetical protein